ncbi:PREDICTED: zinc finger CCCH domain-containing protein 19 [Nelumbo nucifera]|uniref:Zinc finger CCCH domain-containing protein 19-like n=2 Tax=Nelumbo nucifera TaxID=4432 RepID=A0A822Z5Q6_NELNU|nr:PREDICTED: zinc finger CCCH domain-containing protein 19 [Nelumbo nucifera]DAD40412.1 TPA_asm: hypothetical protein HUJ06_014735 [Nelumbo nucifera]
MEEEEECAGVYRPSLKIEHSNHDKFEELEEFPNVQQCGVIPEMDDSQLVGGSPVVTEGADVAGEGADVAEDESAMVGEGAAVAGEEASPMEEAEVEMEMDAEETEVTETTKSGGKRKRGRQAKVQPRYSSKKNEEDVCFICFDGGNLVLCDRRGCPKAYHPACVNRDEAFFRSKGRWNCGWHICSKCEKASSIYMCYTCTFSLCKNCINLAEFFSVRGNKGFCATCRSLVMLIENGAQANPEMANVDFDDKSNWEYLFKDYWMDLKQKLSLALEELTQARNLSKGSGDTQKDESSDELYDAKDDKGSNSDSSSGHAEEENSKRRKARKRSKTTKIGDSPGVAEAAGGDEIFMPDNIEWASKELLEFVSHMRNGDKSVLSQFDVQALLLEYIKKNKLRDPRRKSQIICDLRLENLFGKPRVGHFEMLKLLESHFLIKDDPQADDIQGEAVNTDASPLDVDGNNDIVTKASKDKKRKTRKKGDEKGPQTNLDDYAAIDVHNVNLIYLRRSLMEDLLDDTAKFHDKVIGSFVKIRISGNNQKQDMYRLVQVIGTCKAAESYKTGKKETNVMLEILNLNKTEIISIDTISNQEFSEDECKRLRQSIKCGLINRLTVGEVQEKAMALQAVRVNDCLESEKLRLSHLRDRASEKGRRKELRELVEKLQLLNTPEELSRRLQEIPEVHADPNMDPSYESEEDEGEPDDKNRDNFVRPRDDGFSRKGREREPISPGKGGSATYDGWSGARKSFSSWESSKNVSMRSLLDKGDGAIGSSERTHASTWNQGRDTSDSSSWEKPKNQTVVTGLDTGGWNTQGAVRSSIPSSGSAPLSAGTALSTNINETEKMWHYQDPSGKVQGPFSMVQLRKWSTTGYFPADLRIWRSTEKQEDSILLTDALNGKFLKDSLRVGNSFSQPQKVIPASDNRESSWNGGWRGNNGTSDKVDGWGSRSSGWIATAPEVVNHNETQTGVTSRGWSSSRSTNAWSVQPQVHNQHPSPSFSGKPYRMPSHQGREGQGGERWNSGQNRGTWNPNKSTGFQSSSGHGYEKRSSNWGSSGQPSAESWRSQSGSSSLKGWSSPSSGEAHKVAREGWGSDQGSKTDSTKLLTPTPGGNIVQHSVSEPLRTASGWGEQPHISLTSYAGSRDSGAASVLKPSDTSDKVSRIDFSNPPTPTPKSGSGGWAGSQGVENKLATAPTATAQETNSWGNASNPSSDVMQQSVSSSNEPIKINADLGNQMYNPAKPPAELDSGSESGKLAYSSTVPVSTKPAADGIDGSDVSQTSISGSNGFDSLANQAVFGLPHQNDSVAFSAGSVSKGGEDLIQGPKNDCSLHDIVIPSSSANNNQIPLQLTCDDKQHGVARALDQKEKFGCDSSPSAHVDKESRPSDVSVQQDPVVKCHPGTLMLGADTVSNESSPSQAAVSSVPGLASSVNGNNPPDGSHGTAHGSIQGLEMVVSSPITQFQSHGPGDAPALKQELPTSSPVPATGQKSEAATAGQWGDGQSSGNYSAVTLGAADHTRSYCNPGVSVPNSSSNFIGPAGIEGSNWSTPLTAPPTKTSNWGVGAGATQGSTQNNYVAPSDPRKPLMPGNQWEMGSNIQPPAASTAVWGAGSSENPASAWGPTQGNANMGWGGSNQGNSNTGWGSGQGATMQGNTNVGWGAPAGNPGMWASQQKHNGERFSGHGDRGSHGGDSGHGGGRPSWNRQLSFGSGGSPRPPPRGQRVCKYFHENGQCKKGASCDYLHT